MRDPRRDPRPGDRLKKASQTRWVVYITVSGHVVYDLEGTPHDQRLIACKVWRRWAADAEVLEHGPEEAVLPYKREVVIDYGIQGQIMRLANRVANDHRISTPEEEALFTLLEMGIEQALTSDGEAKFKKAMDSRITPRNDPY